ncbi:MAG: TIGR03086 family protein [Pseudonocardia sp.]|uniref:TIGR03086 family metal-binding protein n=1 Tax=unclassified Pseudonocardia TaxID=2619320 RepID=UPI00086F2751|nr:MULTISPECIES: TIGR03086 family metal-binding protein [unclassified Pseudonocardia]MBN9109088.1 TIGR03086 family protein [Pseudonocardia sp.]ODU07123.1 MAG: TIGR03086 family protein [Pseudonocardia sp. SCN 72-51]ODV02535.1 MAG: TIGR03086 family protein [Pseudonocardia sp. SCN 73-27]
MTTSTAQQIDPRPLLHDAVDWVRGLVDGVAVERYGDPTPCDEFDVRTLLAHLAGIMGRAHAAGTGTPPLERPALVTGISDDDLAAAVRQAIDALEPLWHNDTMLDEMIDVPWGRVPGRGVVWGYLNETLVHGWDLAVATGQDCEADPAAAEAALATFAGFLPAEPRGGPVPFGPVVEPAADAGPTERLANWSGHARIDRGR